MRPAAILTKGSREKPSVRRAVKKKGPAADADENVTIPDTEGYLTD